MYIPHQTTNPKGWEQWLFGLENLVNKCTCVLNEWTLKEWTNKLIFLCAFSRYFMYINIKIWSGYPRWLFSCFLYIPCSASPCLKYTLLTWPPTYLPQAQRNDIALDKNSPLCLKGWWGACCSAGFPDNPWANLKSTPLQLATYPCP